MNARLSLLCLPLIALLAAVAAPPTRAAEVYDLDQSHFSIVFSVSHMNMSYTYGMFRQANARVVLDPRIRPRRNSKWRSPRTASTPTTRTVIRG